MFKGTIQFEISRAALAPLAAFGLSITCGLFNGAGKSYQVITGGVKKFEHWRTADDRMAIQAIGRKLKDATDKLGPERATFHESKETTNRLYEALMDMDVSACPQDFRNQYQKTIIIVRAFNTILDDIPEDDSGKNMYFLRRFGSSNPDLEGKELARRVEAAREEMHHQLSELKAIAHSYGADQNL